MKHEFFWTLIHDASRFSLPNGQTYEGCLHGQIPSYVNEFFTAHLQVIESKEANGFSDPSIPS